ncbi:vitamin K epoxide reductase family protein [Spirosoma soli]|uniref:Vitamin K epoxide reductase family protein n=1 Tax=Spirosoma soli TaxID=1770529 RepID=A0ABW5MDL6_9BACT
MNPTQLSRELREGQSPDLTNRRWIIGLSLLGTVAGQLVTMYQTGIIKHLPDPPIPYVNSDKVDASDYAYKRLNTPDAVMMIVTYGLTAWLAAAGGKNRAEKQPWLPIAMGLKTITDTATNLQLAREEWQENKAFCAYCQAASLLSVASVALAVPEMIKGFRKVFKS